MTFLLAFSFGSARIKEFLRNSYYLALPRLQLGDELKLEFSIFIMIGLNSWNKLDKSLLVALDALDKSEVSTIDSFFHSDPRMILESSFAHLVAHVQNFRHLGIRDHFNLSPIDSLYSMNEGQHVRHIMGLDINATRSFVAVED